MHLATFLGKLNQIWLVFVFLTIKSNVFNKNTMIFGFVTKLHRESRPLLIQFYVPIHSVLVTHFNPKKVESDTNWLFYRSGSYIGLDLKVRMPYQALVSQ